MSDILEKISAYKLEEIAVAKKARPYADLERAARMASPVRGFQTAIADKIKAGGHALIAEIKKASPSKGLIRADFNPPEIARAYERGGAACLSILTDGPSFQGSADYLMQAREAVALPVLRKDFMYDVYQVAEAREMGADCILIIMASVSDNQARELEGAALDWGMDAIVEVHNEVELERALRLKTALLGINNRNLKTFETTLATTERLAPMCPKDKLIIGESGIFTPADLARLARVGVRAFLVGESLMRQADVETATRTLISQ